MPQLSWWSDRTIINMNSRSLPPSHKYASFVSATFPPNPCCSYTASTGSLTVLALRKLFEQHFIDGPWILGCQRLRTLVYVL